MTFSFQPSFRRSAKGSTRLDSGSEEVQKRCGCVKSEGIGGVLGFGVESF